jgi:hypothetical protein
MQVRHGIEVTTRASSRRSVTARKRIGSAPHRAIAFHSDPQGVVNHKRRFTRARLHTPDPQERCCCETHDNRLELKRVEKL